MGTKTNPGNFDCYANAEPDEPMFVLLARDPAAAATVRTWVDMRLLLSGGKIDDNDLAQLREAMSCAVAMDEWRKRNR